MWHAWVCVVAILGRECYQASQKTKHNLLWTELLLTGQDNGAEDSGDTEDELRRYAWDRGSGDSALGVGDVCWVLTFYHSWLRQGS